MPVRRGEVYDAALDPTRDTEQAGTRPVIVVSRDAINAASNVVIAVPCTTFREGRRIYPSQVLLRTPEGGLGADSVALGEQVRAISRRRLGRRRGSLSREAASRLDRALLIALDLET
ncbi:MAG: type II toxin-antitoxin system PemK/MazF family toxin [Actinomycetota bacterium]|nr:type II toxin-antitoxin system PemK/MazF family toxin [Actinomycetota bacterium]